MITPVLVKRVVTFLLRIQSMASGKSLPGENPPEKSPPNKISPRKNPSILNFFLSIFVIFLLAFWFLFLVIGQGRGRVEIFSRYVKSLLLLNAIGAENFEKMQFDRPLQLGTEEYFL